LPIFRRCVGQSCAGAELFDGSGQIAPERSPAHRGNVPFAIAQNMTSERHSILCRAEVDAASLSGQVSVSITGEEIKVTPMRGVEREIGGFTGTTGVESASRAHTLIEYDEPPRRQNRAGW